MALKMDLKKRSKTHQDGLLQLLALVQLLNLQRLLQTLWNPEDPRFGSRRVISQILALERREWLLMRSIQNGDQITSQEITIAHATELKNKIVAIAHATELKNKTFFWKEENKEITSSLGRPNFQICNAPWSYASKNWEGQKSKRHQNELPISTKKKEIEQKAEEDLQVREIGQFFPMKSTSNSGRQNRKPDFFGFGEPRSSKVKRHDSRCKQVHDKGINLSKKILEDRYIPPPSTIVESVSNATDELNTIVVSPRLIQQVDQSNPCSTSSISTWDKTTPWTQENGHVEIRAYWKMYYGIGERHFTKCTKKKEHFTKCSKNASSRYRLTKWKHRTFQAPYICYYLLYIYFISASYLIRSSYRTI